MANPNDNENCFEPEEVCLEWDPVSGRYILTTNFGNEKIIDAPAVVAPKVTNQIVVQNGICFLQTFVNGVLCDNTALNDVTDKIQDQVNTYDFLYDPTNHEVSFDCNGQTVFSRQLKCGRFEIDQINCVARYTDEKNVVTEHPFPTANLSCDVQADGSRVYCFDNGTNKPGSKKLFTVPAPAPLDIDNATLVDGILTLMYGGDGNPSTLVYDACAVIAANCNATITSFDANGFSFVDNAGNTFTIPFPDNCCTYHDVGQPYNPNGNVPPGTKLAQANDNDTLIVKYPANADGVAALGYYTCRDGAWIEDFICPLGVPQKPEVFIGDTQPSKSDGYLVWFNPVTCVVKYCDNDGKWFEPRNVICSATAPPCGKGYADIWFNTAEGCLYVCCEGVWISSDAQAIRSVIDKLCIKVGDGPLQDLAVIDGKVVIPIPAPVELDRYCVQIGNGQEIFGQETNTGKFRFNLPAYPTPPEIPEQIETCLRIGGLTGDVIAPHLENGKYFLDFDFPEFPEFPDPVTKEDIVADFISVGGTIPIDAASFLYLDNQGRCRQGALPAYPEIPEFPALPTVKSGTSNVTIQTTTGAEGEPCYAVSVGEQDIPPLPIFCVEDKSGSRIDATIESGKIVINLPPIVACQPNQPAVNGSAGCFWFDGECLYVLCDSTWVSADASTTQE